MTTNCSFLRLFTSIVAVTLIASIGHADNWPRFRGPNGQGISAEKDFPAVWQDDDIAWTIDLKGTGRSSPVVWGNLVFSTFAEGGKFSLQAANVADGSTVWQRDYDVTPLKLNKLNSVAYCTPAVDENGVVFIVAEVGHTWVIALDLKGRDQWKKDFGPAHFKHGPGTSPMIYKGMVVFTHEQEENEKDLNSCWLALDRSNGDARWRLERKNTGHGSNAVPCVVRGKGGDEALVFTSRAHGIALVDPEKGEVIWEDNSALDIARAVASPVIAGDKIVATCGVGGSGKKLAVARVNSADMSKSTLSYTLVKKTFIPNVSTSVADDNRLFMFHDNGLVTCMDISSGEVIWSHKGGGSGGFYCSPLLVGDKLFCVTRKGQMVVLRAGGQYEQLAVRDLGEQSSASLAMANGRMFIRTDSRLTCIAPK